SEPMPCRRQTSTTWRTFGRVRSRELKLMPSQPLICRSNSAGATQPACRSGSPTGGPTLTMTPPPQMTSTDDPVTGSRALSRIGFAEGGGLRLLRRERFHVNRHGGPDSRDLLRVRFPHQFGVVLRALDGQVEQGVLEVRHADEVAVVGEVNPL